MNGWLAVRDWSLTLAQRTAVFINLAFITGSLSAQDAETAPPSNARTGNWSARLKLEDNGITPFATLTGEAWGNVSGGLQQRGWVNSLLDFGIELDTGKLGWWQGGRFVAQAHWVENLRNGVCFSDYTGAFNPVSSIESGDHLRVFNLHYRHVWREDIVVLKVGQIAVDDDFMGSDYASLFLNSAFGAMPSQVGTPLATSCGGHPPFPIYSVAAPGLFLRVQPFESFYSQLGFYYGKPGFDERSNYGFDWASESGFELGLFWESGYTYQVAKRSATLRLGLSHHTGPLDDFSAPPGESTDTPQTVPNFYAIHDLQLFTDGEGKTKLGLFCRGGFTPHPDLSMVAWYADAGLNWFAPLPGRSDDVAGVAVSHTRFGEAFRQSTSPDGMAADETTVELTYKAQVTRWLAMQADVQFLFNPAVNPRSNSRETATVLGLRAEITF